MIRASIRRPSIGIYREFARLSIQRAELAALAATDRASAAAKSDIRQGMSGARLGRLGMAIGSGSDLRKNGSVHRSGNGFRASGWLFIRSRSERTVGAIKIYSESGESKILPTKGWLWIPTDNVPKRVGRYKMTPARYMKSGLATSIGPLVQIPGRHSGESLLVVNKVSYRAFGRPNPRKLPRNGRARAGRQVAEQLVMFVGITRTSRAQRFSPQDYFRQQQALLPSYWHQELSKV